MRSEAPGFARCPRARRWALETATQSFIQVMHSKTKHAPSFIHCMSVYSTTERYETLCSAPYDVTILRLSGERCSGQELPGVTGCALPETLHLLLQRAARCFRRLAPGCYWRSCFLLLSLKLLCPQGERLPLCSARLCGFLQPQLLGGFLCCCLCTCLQPNIWNAINRLLRERASRTVNKTLVG